MSNSKDVMSKLVEKSLSEYGDFSSKSEHPSSKPDLFSPRPKARIPSVYKPRTLTSVADYAATYPPVQSTLVSGVTRMKNLSAKLRELPWPEGETARYARRDYEVLVDTLTGFMLDATEEAGLLNQGGAGSALRDALSDIIKGHFHHADPYDGVVRSITVGDK